MLMTRTLTATITPTTDWLNRPMYQCEVHTRNVIIVAHASQRHLALANALFDLGLPVR